MEKGTLVLIVCAIWLILFIYLLISEKKGLVKDFFRKKDEMVDKNTRYIIEKKRERTKYNTFRAYRYAVIVCIFQSLGGAIIIGGAICWILTKCFPKQENRKEEPIEEYDASDFFDDAHRPERY